VPTFCRHNRFVERCPICSKTLVDQSASEQSRTKPRRASAENAPKGTPVRARNSRLRAGARDVRVHRESRAGDDGYRSALLPGLRASRDALALAEEIAFAHGCLLALQEAPPDLYGEVRALADGDIEQATWMCFLIAYFSPLDGEDPFAGIRLALPTTSDGGTHEGVVPGDLDEIPLGPRSSHDPARAASTLLAYRQWAERAGNQAHAFEGDLAWSPQRRFERCFERLALPGFGRMGRYDLLVTLGCLGLYEMRADSLHFISANESPTGDLTTLAAKRVFAIGDPLNLERRAQALAEAISVSVATLDLALANWGSGTRATLGVRSETCDLGALERTRAVLGL
jgi:Alpha-glutamyl/putrescinyl thymine pyrophosphorylase clade 3